jgi:hypothetical protein
VLSQYNAIDIESALAGANPPPPFPPVSDRASWEALRADLGEEKVAEAIGRAEEDARSEVPSLPATLYLECERTGERSGYERPMFQRRTMLSNLAVGECLENKGRFLDPLLNVAWAICEESSWAFPAHQFQLADMERPRVDLGVAMTSLDLAELDLLLGSALDPLLSKRIRYEIDRRCLTPYLTRHDFVWLYNTQDHRVNNWSAVCNAGVVGAAIYLEPDTARLAEIIARAARSLDDYLATFDPDGGSEEGPGYWAYGFGHFVLLAHLVEQRTEGRIEFLRGEHIRKIAQFPLRSLLSPGIQVNFSDARREAVFHAGLLAFLARRLDLPPLMALAREQAGKPFASVMSLAWHLRNLFWHPTGEWPGDVQLTRHDWFGGMMWMIARLNPADPNALVLAAKGGHNAESHNHNDLGTFLVQVNGEAIIADPGTGRYTRDYFGPHRYEHPAASSMGHSVPVPNGQRQLAGREYAAKLLEHRAEDNLDLLALELKGAYPPEADLASLKRTVTLHRNTPRGRVTVEDEAKFATEPGRLESVLITFGAVETGEGKVVLRGECGALRVRFDAQAVIPRIEELSGVDLAEGKRDLRRAIFASLAPGRKRTIRLEIEPD